MIPPSSTSTPPLTPLLNPGDGQSFDATYGSKIWRIQNLYKIKNKRRRTVPMRLNRIQWHIFNAIKDADPIRYINVKFRQGGVSTFFLVWHLDDTIFRPNTNTGVLSHKRESLGYLMDIIRLAHRTMPDKLRPGLGDDSKTGLSFPVLNSRIFVSLSIRSTTVHNLHISEWCLAKDAEVQASLGAAVPDAHISGESTGNGIANDGYLTYMDAKAGLNGYKGQFFPWFMQEEYRAELNGMDPGLVMKSLAKDERGLIELARRDYGLAVSPEQILFRRIKKKALKGIFPQEYPETEADAFITAGNHFFNSKKILSLIQEARAWARENEPVQQDDDFTAWEAPRKGDIYAAGADTAEGGADYSVLKILNVTQRREAFRFRARVNIKTFYKVCDQWSRAYNNALLAVERNNHGHAVLLGLESDCRYPNLYAEDDERRRRVVVSGKTAAQAETKLGWITDKASRHVMLDHLKWAIEGENDEDVDHFQSDFTVYDQELLLECLTFVNADGKFEAEEGKHDDDIVASAIAYQMFQRLRRASPWSLSHRVLIGSKRETTI
jgi:hypothetical protein